MKSIIFKQVLDVFTHRDMDLTDIMLYLSKGEFSPVGIGIATTLAFHFQHFADYASSWIIATA